MLPCLKLNFKIGNLILKPLGFNFNVHDVWYAQENLTWRETWEKEEVKQKVKGEKSKKKKTQKKRIDDATRQTNLPQLRTIVDISWFGFMKPAKKKKKKTVQC